MSHRLFPLPCLARTVLGAAMLCLAGAAAAKPFFYWNFNTPADGYQVTFKPTADPGPASNVYWASQYLMEDGSVAYMGLQSPREGGKGPVLWSVWSAVAVVADGSPGVICDPFDENGIGYSCHTGYPWKVGNTYTFKLTSLGNGWVRNTLTEVETGTVIDLGKMQVNTPSIYGGINWVEYWDWNDDAFNWDGAPHAGISWSNVTSASGEVATMSNEATPEFGTETVQFSADKTAVEFHTYAQRSAQLPLQNQASGLCLQASERTSAGTPSACPSTTDAASPDRDLTWTFTNASAGGTSQINALHACITANSTSHAVALTSPCSSKLADPSDLNGPQPSAQWVNNLAIDGTLRLAANPNLCLQEIDGAYSVGACTGATNQTWRHQLSEQSSTIIDPTAWWTLSSQATGSCIEDARRGTTNGSVVQQRRCATTHPFNQQWQFQPTDSGYYRIASRQAPNLVIDAPGADAASPLHLWNYVGGDNQQWRPIAVGNGYYKLVGRASGLCIDVPGASAQDNLQLQLWDCNDTDAQAFKLNQR